MATAETTVVLSDVEKAEKKAKRKVRDNARNFFRGLYHDKTLAVASLGKRVTAGFREHITALYPAVVDEYGKGTGGLAQRIVDWVLENNTVSDAGAFNKFRIGANDVRKALLGYMDDEPEMVFYFRTETSEESDFPLMFWSVEESAVSDNADDAKPTWEPLRKLRNHGNGSTTEAPATE